MNDHYSNDDWEKNTEGLGLFGRPQEWPERSPLVKILAWTLMPNHFHLLLKETEDSGISKFMQKLGNSMSMHANLKHKEKGSLFQGSYKARTVATDSYLRWLASYIMVKNVFELYPGGLERAGKEFDAAWRWGTTSYKFSSLPDYVAQKTSPVLEKDILAEIFNSVQDFKKCSRDMLEANKMSKELHMLAMDA
ncbi:MAG: transposase [bacterium]|nr:transposase [bacterium]